MEPPSPRSGQPQLEMAEDLRRELRQLETYHSFVTYTLLRPSPLSAGVGRSLDPHRLSELGAQLVQQTLPAASTTVQLYLLESPSVMGAGGGPPSLVAWLPDGERIAVDVSENAREPIRMALEGESEVDPVVVAGSGLRAPALLSRVVDRCGEVMGLVQVIAAAADVEDGGRGGTGGFGPGDAEALSGLQDQLCAVLLLLRLLHRDPPREQHAADETASVASVSSLFVPSPAKAGMDVLARALADERAEGRRLRERVALLDAKYKQAKRELRGLQADWEEQTRQLVGQAAQETTRRGEVEAQLQRRGKVADAARRLLGSAVAGVWRALEEAAFLTDVQSVSERVAAALLQVLVPGGAAASGPLHGGIGSPSRNGEVEARHLRAGARILFVAGRAGGDADADDDGEGQRQQQHGPLVLTTAAGLVDAEAHTHHPSAPPSSASSPARSPGRAQRRMEVVPGSLTEAALLEPTVAALLVPDARKDGRYTAACDGGATAAASSSERQGSMALALIPLRNRAFLPDGSCQGAEPLGVMQLWGPAGGGGGDEDGNEGQGMVALLRLEPEDAQAVLSTLGALLSLVLEWCLAGRRGSRLRGDLLQGAAQLLAGSGAVGLTLGGLQAWVDRLLPSLWGAGPAAHVRATIRVLDPAAWEEAGQEGRSSPLPSPSPSCSARAPPQAPGLAPGSVAEEALSKGCPVLAIGPCLAACQQQARRRRRLRGDGSQQQQGAQQQQQEDDAAVAAAAVVATRVVEALLERGGCSVRGPPAPSSSSTRLLTLSFPLCSTEGQALGALDLEMRAASRSRSSAGPSDRPDGGGAPASVQLDALQQVVAGLLGPALGRALARRQAVARVQAQEAEQDRRLADMQAHVDDVASRQEALRQANDALAAENDRLAGALAPLRAEHEALLAKYRRLKLSQAEAGESSRLLKAEKHVLAKELDRCRRAVRESKARLAHTNEELLELRGTLVELSRRVEGEGEGPA